MLGKRKRSLQLEPDQRESLRQILTEQIDLEIALKKRLSVAAHARLEWAKILRSSLLFSDISSRGHPPTAFHDAALSTYESIEAPCQIISSTNPPPLANGKRLFSPAISAPELPRTRKRATFGLVQTPPAGPILFEDRSTSTAPVTLKLVCTDCFRSDFPTMQGFFNHCRLAHSRVYGTHDECIQATGVAVDVNERETLLASGVEINTVNLPSLRGMFERAVGLAPTKANAPHPSQVTEHSQSIVEQSGISNHLSQTLGLHKDTPTLAPFLGKRKKKKYIHVYDASEPIDIISGNDGMLSDTRTPCYIKHRSRRNTDGNWSMNSAALSVERTGDIQTSPDAPSGVLDSQISRFHITRRVLVSDRSLYLPEIKRPAAALSHTHRWQISVSSPSYGQHITAFLSRFTVTCVTRPPVFTSPISVSGPPFVACGTADKPFLARLTFQWVGEQNHTFDVDHWVELDPMKAARPSLGEEQMFDVELDRNTAFLPVRDIPNTIPWHGDCDHRGIVGHDGSTPVLKLGAMIDEPIASEPEHVKLLKSIIPRFPITMQDFGTRQPPIVPYILYPSRTKLLSLTPGRRKAIEWRRALEIRTEYDALQASSTSEDKIRLTTGEVYRLLDAEGFSPRPRTHLAKSPSSPPSVPPTPPYKSLTAPARFCSVCGINIKSHTPGIRVAPSDYNIPETAGFQCLAAFERRRAPIVQVYALLGQPGYWNLHPNRSNITSSPRRDLVMVAHPQLTRFVRQEVASLSLSCFSAIGETQRERRLPFGSEIFLGRNLQEVDEILSTHALLAITLTKLVKDLVGGAVQVACEMHVRTRTMSDEAHKTDSRSLLTPTHVLQGLLMRQVDVGRPKEALFMCLSRVGTLMQVGGGPPPPPPPDKGRGFLQLSKDVATG